LRAVIDTSRVSIIELRHLTQFVAVAELRNFRRAAEHLNMSQPPLSQAIRRLEAALGVRLFDRTSRSVELTVAGEAFLVEARRILAQIDSAITETRRTADGRKGRLSVGFTVPWAYEVVLPALRAFRARCPDVVLSLKEITSSEQMRALACENLDVGFVRLPKRYDARDVQTVVLREDRLIVALPVSHRLAARPALTLEELRSEAFILPPVRPDRDTERFSFRMQVGRLCMEAGFAPHVAQEAAQMQTVVRLVEAGLGISLVPEWTSRHFSFQVAYRNLACDSDDCRLTLCAAWNRRNPSPVLHRFLAAIGAAEPTASKDTASKRPVARLRRRANAPSDNRA
jgi:DNA-binding transcriptional LysR family regulator